MTEGRAKEPHGVGSAEGSDVGRADADSGFEGVKTWIPPSFHGKTALRLLVIAEDRITTHPLPDDGTVSVGRSSAARIAIDDPSISRMHAMLHIGASLYVQDLGSTNGTRVRGTLLKPNELRSVSVGEVIDVGLVSIVLQPAAVGGRPLRLWTHGYFELRLEEECERARRSTRPLGVLRVTVRERAEASKLESTLNGVLRPFDVVASYAPGDFEILLIDTPCEEAEAIADAIRAGLREIDVEVDVGRASFPEDGLASGDLLDIAGRRAHNKPVPGPARRLLIEDGAVVRLIERIAPSNINVLIVGETGVGKEIVAEELHRRSRRHDRPLLRINCAALSEALLESELFGHERGAFTGAEERKPGLLETAEGGTVLLDEIGELPIGMQAKLLRIIEERQVRRVGALEGRPIDVRFLFATNRDLEAEIGRGTFRKDLYFRISGVTVFVPPLRERKGAVAAFAELFLEESARELSRLPHITPGAMRLLEGYSWPGNVRELKHVIERAVLLAEDGVVTPAQLPLEKMSVSHLQSDADVGRSRLLGPPEVPPIIAPEPDPTSPGTNPIRLLDAPDDGSPEAGATLQDDVERVERARIIDALERCRGNQTQAAALLGVSRRTLISRIEKYNLPRPRKP